MTKQLLNRGFTLIELLVVIAIIGILASVVLASLNSARDKGEDAATQSTINNMRAQAELYYDDNSRTYGTETASCAAGMFGDSTQFAQAIAQLDTTVVCQSSDGLVAQGGAADSWALAGLLNTGDYYCVDSSGYAGTSSAPVQADNTANDAVCP